MFNNSKPNVILLTDTHYSSGRIYGISRIASELRKAGYQVAVIYYASVFSYPELCKIFAKLVSDQTLFIGINNFCYFDVTESEGAAPYNPMLPYPERLNDEFRQYILSLNPNCKFVHGGPTAADVQWNKRVFDYIINGYADNSIINLANHLKDGEPLTHAHKSIYGPVVISDTKAQGFDFVNSSTEYTSYDCLQPNETVYLEVARGCIFKCAFCGFPLNGKKKLDYIKNFDTLYNELMTNYELYGITHYCLNDDTFNDSVEKIQQFLDVSKKLPFKLEYWAYIRIDLLLANPGTLDMLYESGLRGMFVGIETWIPESGKVIGKRADKEKHLNLLRHIKEKYNGTLLVEAAFIIGLPGDTVDNVTETYQALLENEDLLVNRYVDPLWIVDPNFKEKTFLSKIEQNYEAYGYTNTGLDKRFIVWKNEHMDYQKAKELASGLWSSPAELEALFAVLNNEHDLNWWYAMLRDNKHGASDAIQQHRLAKRQTYRERFISEFGIEL
jgi:hypothetical protein